MLSVATYLQGLPEQPVSSRVTLAVEPSAQTTVQKMCLYMSQPKKLYSKKETAICTGACMYNCMQV